MAMVQMTILRTYAERTDPATLPDAVRFSHSAESVTVFDKFPKSRFHFLLLPRVVAPLRATQMRDLRTLLHAVPRERARALLQACWRDALEVKARIEDEMRRSYGFVWGVQIGFHAVPSMEYVLTNPRLRHLMHVHIHIMSTDFREKALKTKRHLNSFHPKLGFFIHLEDVLSWLEPDVDPTWYEMKRDIDKKACEALLRTDLTCPHCGEPYKTMPKLQIHLALDFKRKVDAHRQDREAGCAPPPRPPLIPMCPPPLWVIHEDGVVETVNIDPDYGMKRRRAYEDEDDGEGAVAGEVDAAASGSNAGPPAKKQHTAPADPPEDTEQS